MVSLDTQVSQDHPGLRQGFDNMFASSNSHATNANAMVSQTVEGIMEDNEYVSSSVKLLTRLLQAKKDNTKEVPSIEEQLHVLDQGINSTPMFSNLKPENSGIASATIPKFYHAISCTNVTKENQCLIRDEVRFDVDSLEVIQIKQFNMGLKTTPKERKGECGRPRKSLKGV